mgnify:CR=1 FL=1
MNYVNRLNQWLDKPVSTAQEKLANKRLAKKANLQLNGEINRLQIEIADLEDALEEFKNSKEFNPTAMWLGKKKTMLLEKEMDYYQELKKELF